MGSLQKPSNEIKLVMIKSILQSLVNLFNQPTVFILKLDKTLKHIRVPSLVAPIYVNDLAFSIIAGIIVRRRHVCI